MTTNSKFNTAEVVRFARDTAQRLEAEGVDLSPALERAVGKHFPQLTCEQWCRVVDVWTADVEAERAEFEAEAARAIAGAEMAMQIFAGLKHLNFMEACRIKAQGEGPVAEAARCQLIALNSVRAQLCSAALKAHPNFVERTEGHWLYTGPGEMPSDDAVIEWFQINHPAQARAIEDGASP